MPMPRWQQPSTEDSGGRANLQRPGAGRSLPERANRSLRPQLVHHGAQVAVPGRPLRQLDHARVRVAPRVLQVLAGNPRFAKEVAIDATEPEPDLGKPRNASDPGNAPPYRPDVPPCAPAGSTLIWQYGESVDRDNYADIDQVNPRTAGLLAPDGSVTGGPR